MAHPQPAEAASAPTTGDPAAEFENFLFGDDEEGDEAQAEPQETDEPEDAAEEDDLDLDGEDGETDDEPQAAIEPPVSLNAEEKALFAQLPAEAQQAWSASENRRNQQVQEATTKAATAQREAEARAATADRQAKAVYVEQLTAVMEAVKPPAPDYSLAETDPAAYIARKAEYDAGIAQYEALMQQVQQMGQEVAEEANAEFLQQRERDLMAIPEIANEETRKDYIDRAFATAEMFGYSRQDVLSKASAQELKAFAEAAAWKQKADKYDAAMSRKMQRVRAGKSRTNRPQSGPHAEARTVKADRAWQTVKNTRDKGSKADAFADYLEATGNL